MCSEVLGFFFPNFHMNFYLFHLLCIPGALARQRGALQHARREKVSKVTGVKLGKVSLRD